MTFEWTQHWKDELEYPIEKTTWSGGMLSAERKKEILEIQKKTRW